MKTRLGLLLITVMIFSVLAVINARGFGEGGEGGSCTDTGNFVYTGSVLLSNYSNASTDTDNNMSTNISVYNISFSATSLTKTLTNTTVTGSAGDFSITVPQGNCDATFVIEVVTYNLTSWNALEVGPPIPPMPKVAITSFMEGQSIYQQTAATLNISAFNNTGNVTPFNYVVMDNKLGYPVAEQFGTQVNNASIVLPRARNYTIIFMREPDPNDPASFATAVPPLTTTVNNISNYSDGQHILTLTKNMTYQLYNVSGNITVSGNSSIVNATTILTRLGVDGLLPQNAFISIPGMQITSMSAGHTIASYNIQVTGNTDSGVYQVLEWYAGNTTSSGSDHLAYFQNFTITGHRTLNVTLTSLSGLSSAVQQGSSLLASSYVKINLTDANGAPLRDAHSEIVVDNTGLGGIGQFRYMVDQLEGGIAQLPILANANATLKVFSGRYAPLEKKLNLSNSSNGIIKLQLNAFRPTTFHSNGSSIDFGGKGGNMRVRLMQNSAACNVYLPAESCSIRDFDAGFDPMSAMMGGQVNIRMEIGNGTGVVLYFLGVDLLASGPPDAEFSQDPLSEQTGDIREKVFRFGSAAPIIYDRVLVGLPYTEGDYEETGQVNFTIKSLYDNDNNLVWNASTDLNATQVPSEWSDYNVTFFNSTAGGMPCVSLANEAIDQCYINTSTNFVWVSIPHFTSGEGGPVGSSDTTPPSTTAIPGTINDSDQDGNIEMSWTDDAAEVNETYIILRSIINQSVYNSSFTNLTAVGRVKEGVEFFEDNTSTSGTTYFYAIMTVDSATNANFTTNNTFIGLWLINVTANDTFLPKSPTGVSVSGSNEVATIRWAAVRHDINGNADVGGLTYNLYRNSSVPVNLTNLTLVNATNSGFTQIASGISSNFTTNAVTTSGFYHYVVTSVDETGMENKSFVSAGMGNYGNATLDVGESTTSSTSSSSSSSGGGGGGGGGGGVPQGTKAGTKTSHVWGVLDAGENTMTVKKAEISISKIVFTSKTNARNVELSLEAFDDIPSSWNNLPDDHVGFQFIDVVLKNLGTGEISKAVFHFKVEQSWVSQQGVTKNDVVLMRYDGGWKPLSTTFVDEDTIYYDYEGISPGFSRFAVAAITSDTTADTSDSNDDEAELTLPSNQTGNETAPVQEQTIEDEGAGGGLVKFLIILVILLVLIGGAAGAVLFYKKRTGNYPPMPDFKSFFSRFKRGKDEITEIPPTSPRPRRPRQPPRGPPQQPPAQPPMQQPPQEPEPQDPNNPNYNFKY